MAGKYSDKKLSSTAKKWLKPVSFSEQLDYLLDQERKKLINKQKLTKMRYFIEKFLDYIEEPPSVFIEMHGTFDRYLDENDNEIKVMFSDPKLLKLTYYVVLDLMLERIPNSKELTLEKISRIARESHFLGWDDRSPGRKGDLEIVKLYWPDVIPETRQKIADIFNQLVGKILRRVSLEELYRWMLIPEDYFEYQGIDFGNELVNQFYLKLAGKREVDISGFPDELLGLIGGYVSRY